MIECYGLSPTAASVRVRPPGQARDRCSQTNRDRGDGIMNTDEKRKAILAKTPTPALVGAALMLDSLARMGQEERMAYAWTCDELERRMGGIQDDAAFDALLDVPDVTYAECLLVTFPELVSS